MAAILQPLPAQPIPPSIQVTWAPSLVPVVCTPPIYGDILVQLFGGITSGLPLLPTEPDPLVLFGGGLQSLGQAFAPMAPIIPVLKIVNAMVEFITNLPANIASAIGFNLNPIVEAAAKVTEAAGDIVSLLAFPVSLAKMIRGFLEVLIGYLNALKVAIVRMIARYTNVNALIAKAAELGNAALAANALCAKERLDSKVAAMNAALAGLAVVMAAFTIILCLVTGGELPLLPTIDAGALVAEVFDPVIAVLTAIRDAIPDLSGFQLSC
jgi:hypothetical protein